MYIFFGRKKREEYKGISIMADLGMHEHVFNEIQNFVKPQSKILDLGCGQGAMSQRLVDNGYDVVSVDINEENFKCVGSKFKKVNFDKQEEIDDFSKKYLGYFDAVIGLEVIEHVENQWNYIRLLKSLVKDGGFLFVSTPNTQSWLSRLHFLINGRFHQFSDVDLSYGHISPISAWEKHLIMEKLDLQILKSLPVGTLPFFYFSSITNTILSLLSLILRPIMRGKYRTGWCLLTICRK